MYGLATKLPDLVADAAGSTKILRDHEFAWPGSLGASSERGRILLRAGARPQTGAAIKVPQRTSLANKKTTRNNMKTTRNTGQK